MNTRTVRQRHVDEIHGYAEKAFAEHQIEQLLDQGVFRHWRCAKPKSSYYLFNVTTIPGRLIIVGDIGLLVVEREYDMLAWARTAAKDIHYFAGKVLKEIPIREYCGEVAKEWCADFVRELRREKPKDWKEQIEKIRELRAINDDEMWFTQNLYESGLVDGCDFPDLQRWSYNFLWCREALMWLLARVEPKDVE